MEDPNEDQEIDKLREEMLAELTRLRTIFADDDIEGEAEDFIEIEIDIRDGIDKLTNRLKDPVWNVFYEYTDENDEVLQINLVIDGSENSHQLLQIDGYWDVDRFYIITGIPDFKITIEKNIFFPPEVTLHSTYQELLNDTRLNKYKIIQIQFELFMENINKERVFDLFYLFKPFFSFEKTGVCFNTEYNVNDLSETGKKWILKLNLEGKEKVIFTNSFTIDNKVITVEIDLDPYKMEDYIVEFHNNFLPELKAFLKKN